MCDCQHNIPRTFTQVVKQDKSSLPMLKYLHCKYKTQFEALFSQIGVNATEANLPKLASAIDQKYDQAGVLKGVNGKPIFFSGEEVLKKIDTSRVESNMCSIM